MTKTFAAIFFSVLCVSLFAASNGVPDCASGYQDSGGCQTWKASGYCAASSLYYTFMTGACKDACGICTAGPPPYTVAANIAVNQAECLQAHNAKRALHSAPNLVWDDQLASDSAVWALHLAQQNQIDPLQHSPQDNSFGENLYKAGMQPYGTLSSCSEAVTSWYDEISYYDFNTGAASSSGKDIGHFTQVVWKASTKVGVGVAAVTQGSYTWTTIVARYAPAGNFQGAFLANVIQN